MSNHLPDAERVSDEDLQRLIDCRVMCDSVQKTALCLRELKALRERYKPVVDEWVYSLDALIAWLDAKYARHEEEGKQAQNALRSLRELKKLRDSQPLSAGEPQT